MGIMVYSLLWVMQDIINCRSLHWACEVAEFGVHGVAGLVGPSWSSSLVSPSFAVVVVVVVVYMVFR